jgi:hypothetical protein
MFSSFCINNGVTYALKEEDEALNLMDVMQHKDGLSTNALQHAGCALHSVCHGSCLEESRSAWL